MVSTQTLNYFYIVRAKKIPWASHSPLRLTFQKPKDRPSCSAPVQAPSPHDGLGQLLRLPSHARLGFPTTTQHSAAH